MDNNYDHHKKDASHRGLKSLDRHRGAAATQDDSHSHHYHRGHRDDSRSRSRDRYHRRSRDRYESRPKKSRFSDAPSVVPQVNPER